MKIERYVSRELEKLHAKRRKRDEAEAARAEETRKLLEQLDFSILKGLMAKKDLASPTVVQGIDIQSQE